MHRCIYVALWLVLAVDSGAWAGRPHVDTMFVFGISPSARIALTGLPANAMFRRRFYATYRVALVILLSPALNGYRFARL